jgi:ParB/RepB/Spo0J family partition protein
MEVVNQVLSIPLNKIFADDEFNCRGVIAPIDVVNLAKDIEQNGLIQPVVVCKLSEPFDGYEYKLIAGYRRFMAHKIIKKTHIEAINKTEMLDEKKARLFNLSENLQRQDLNILQEATAIKRLHELGMSIEYIAKELSKSFGWVQVRVYLLKLPLAIQNEISQGYIAQLQIRDLYTIYESHGEKEAIEATKQLKEAKARGEAGVRLKVKNAKVKNTKRIRSRGEILNMLYHIQDVIGNGLHTRCLAWTAGEISDKDLFVDLKRMADEQGITFVLPEWSD